MPVGLKEANLGQSLRRFGRWWLAECLTLVPRSAMRWLQEGTGASIWLSPRQEGVTLKLIGASHNLLLQRDRDWTSYAPFLVEDIFKQQSLPPRTPIVLCLPDRAIFHRRFILPTSALPNLENIARTEIEQRTPFRLEDIYIDHRTEGLKGDGHKLQIHQRIVRKDLVEGIKRKLGVPGDACLYAVADSDPIDLQKAIGLQPVLGGWSWSRKTLMGLLISSVVFVASIIGSLWWRQQDAVDLAARQLPQLQARAATLRRTLDEAETTRSFIRALVDRKAAPTTLHVWAELTRTLPDGTWLTTLTIEGPHLSISGLSDNATGLVKILSASSLFNEVALSAPITPDPIAGKDRFSLVAQIKGRISTGARS